MINQIDNCADAILETIEKKLKINTEYADEFNEQLKADIKVLLEDLLDFYSRD